MSAPRWTTTPVTLRCTDDTLRTVDGWVSAACPGLAVTRTLEGDTVPPGWSVTHRDSGCRVAQAATRDAAQDVALRLAALTDWSVAADQLRGSPTLAEAVAAVVGLERAGVR